MLKRRLSRHPTFPGLTPSDLGRCSVSAGHHPLFRSGSVSPGQQADSGAEISTIAARRSPQTSQRSRGETCWRVGWMENRREIDAGSDPLAWERRDRHASCMTASYIPGRRHGQGGRVAFHNDRYGNLRSDKVPGQSAHRTGSVGSPTECRCRCRPRWAGSALGARAPYTLMGAQLPGLGTVSDCVWTSQAQEEVCMGHASGCIGYAC